MMQKTVLVLFFLISGISNAQTSLWESQKSFVEYEYNGFTVEVSRIRGFEGQFQARVEDPNLKTVMSFRGQCDRVMYVDCVLPRGSEIKTPAYEKSKLAKDLPIQKLAEAMRLALISTCPELEIIHMQVRGNGYHRTTMAKAHGWIIEEGFLKTEALLKKYAVNIDDTNPQHKYYGTQYAGDCEKEAHIVIRQTRAIAPSRESWHHTPGVGDLAVDARRIAYEFAQQCDKIKKITFELQNTSDSYECPKGTKCYLEAKESKGWEVEIIGYKAKPVQYKQAEKEISYSEIAQYLRKGGYKTLKQYPERIYSFYGSFLIAYSDHFSSCIKNPTVRTLVRETRYYDSSNNMTIRTETSGEDDPIYIERKYAAQFDEAVRIKRGSSALGVLKIIFDVNTQQSIDPIYKQGQGIFKDVQYIDAIMNGKSCTDPDIQLLYENLYTLMH